jgi:hypothetical protein
LLASRADDGGGIARPAASRRPRQPRGPDISIDDVFLLLAMGRGAMEGIADSDARSAVAHRVLDLILGGIEA